VGEFANIGMALDAGVSLLTVPNCCRRRINGQVEHLAEVGWSVNPGLHDRKGSNHSYPRFAGPPRLFGREGGR
jgi:hypothetical protein